LAVAIEKLLSGSERSLMKLFRALNETKALAELLMQRLGVIAYDIQPTTSRRPLRSERADDHVTSTSH
jgi:hypothetical protein